MKDAGWVERLFSSVDNMDTEAFLDFLEDDASFRFGSEDAVTGKEAIRETIEGFFASIKGLRHEILETWFEGETVICQGEVTYTRANDSNITIPFVNILGMGGNRIREYLVYIDIKPLYSPAS
ncbi:MAG: nuclear transport factor 2 family protein [Planctomycetes bacterium]|nr:nuclear transport factor 2 family protein [Planctomycetota bacterium]